MTGPEVVAVSFTLSFVIGFVTWYLPGIGCAVLGTGYPCGSVGLIALLLAGGTLGAMMCAGFYRLDRGDFYLTGAFAAFVSFMTVVVLGS